MKDTILIVDDEIDLVAGLKRSISREMECAVFTATSGEEALNLLSDKPVSLVLTDVSMPEMDGMTLLNKIMSLNPSLTVIMMSGYGTIEIAVKALKHGAYDFIQKPFEFEKLVSLLNKGLAKSRLQHENDRMQLGKNQQISLDSLIGKSSRIQQTRNQIKTLSKTDVTVLITGETGTGKDVAARLIHAMSARGKKQMVTVNCPALPEGLLESELFGHVKGAFTGADSEKKGLFDSAEGSTIFLDEIGDLPLSLQTKLLRVLQNQELKPVGAGQSHKIDVRIIAATNQNLPEKIESGEFRADLFYRLNVANLVMPDLNKIKEDIPLLANHFLAKAAFELKTEAKMISAEVLERLQTTDWPGNTRELENAIRAWTATIPTDTVQLEHIDVEEAEGFGADIDLDLNGPYKQLKEKIIERFTKEYVCRLLKQTEGNVSISAKISGIKRQSLQKIINRYEINVRDYR